MTTNKEQLREDVIDAAREAYKALGVFFLTGGTSDPLRLAHLVLKQKLQALDAPTPVKPEEVEPGTPFRFDYGDTKRIRVAVPMLDGTMGYVDARDVCQFAPGRCLIPIEGEEK